MDLFDYMREKDMEREPSLAPRPRPGILDGAVGQQYIVGEGKLLHQTAQAGKLGSIISHGSPGIGKTTLVRVVTNTTSTGFRQVSAAMAGKRGMGGVVKEAKDNIGVHGRKTILFVDETHRFSKGQQDYLLPFVENGTLILIGATTENSYFEVSGAPLSRSRIFELKPLEKDNVKESIQRAAYDKERGMGIYDAKINGDTTDFLADATNGDARAALSAVELGVLTTAKGPGGRIHTNMAVVQECIQKKTVWYDKNGDDHYGTISAFAKSIRGPDPGTAMYYLAWMLCVGEDIEPIARKTTIYVAEGVGNADSQVLVVMVNAAQVTERIGLPGASIILSQAVAYVATVLESDAACTAVQRAMEAVRSEQTMSVSVHPQDKHYKGAEKLGRGTGYRYAYSYPRYYMQQQYLPDDMKRTVFHEPSDNGHEKQTNAHMKWLKSRLSDICTYSA